MTPDRRAIGRRLATGVLVALLLLAVGSTVGSPVDAGEDAPKSEPVELGALRVAVEHRVGGLTIRQYELPSLSHLSYLLAVGDEAVVIDPLLDVDTYIDDARVLGCEVKRVVLTHVPFDVVAGHTAVRARTGATILVHADSEASFEHQAVEDGHEETLGDVTLELWSTPGHTRDSLSVLVHAPGTAVDPAYVLTGGALLIGGIGRTDLDGEEHPVQVHADQAFDTVQRLKLLSDDTRLCPGRADGSRLGVGTKPGTMSTIGAERKANAFMTAESRSAFVGRALAGLPAKPPYFAAVHAANLVGAGASADAGAGTDACSRAWPADLPEVVAPGRVAGAVREVGAIVVDLRPAATYATLHVEGSLNLPLLGRLETWFGTVVPFDRDAYVVGTDDEIREAQRRLHRIGYPGFAGRLPDGPAAWQEGGLPARSSGLVEPKGLARQMAAWIEPVLVDVRSAGEHQKRRLPNVVHAPLGTRGRWPALFSRDRPLVFICKTAYRSTLAIGFAEQMGFERVGSLDGGVIRWVELGLPIVEMAPLAAGPMPPPDGKR